VALALALTALNTALYMLPFSSAAAQLEVRLVLFGVMARDVVCLWMG